MYNLQADTVYIKWIGVLDHEGKPVDMYAASNANMLVHLGYTPQDMEWAEKVKDKYMAAQAEMICG